MLFNPDQLLLIAGPCSLESLENAQTVAHELARLRDVYPELNIVFKGSFDKANRTSLESDRGPGIQEGLAIFRRIRADHGFPCLTDIHLPEQADIVADVCEVLQIPAFLCRQTDLLVAAAQTGRVVNVKKGQFLSPFEMEFVVNKLESATALADKTAGVPTKLRAKAPEIWLTDRGTSFGYQNLVVDLRSYPIMARLGHPTICDATHAVQLPGAAGGKSGGQREFIETIAKGALAAGAQGLFVETHPQPERALSDAASQIPLHELEGFLQRCLKVWRAVR